MVAPRIGIQGQDYGSHMRRNPIGADRCSCQRYHVSRSHAGGKQRESIKGSFYQDEAAWMIFRVIAEPASRVGFDPATSCPGSIEDGFVQVLIHTGDPAPQGAPDVALAIRCVQG